MRCGFHQSSQWKLILSLLGRLEITVSLNYTVGETKIMKGPFLYSFALLFLSYKRLNAALSKR